MAIRGQSKAGGPVRLAISAELMDKGVEAQPHVAYAFSGGGKLLDSRPVEKGRAVLTVPGGASARAVRVVVGPPAEGDDVLAELIRRGAVERFERLAPGIADHRVEFAVPAATWMCWFLGRCTVRGTLVRRTQSGGLPVDLPVCNATVEIYEVDPLFIVLPRIPDDILDRLRDLLRKPVIPIPIPPEPDPGPILPPIGPFPGPHPGPGPDPGPEVRALRMVSHPVAAESVESLAVPDDLRLAAVGGGDLAFRSALIARPELTQILFCRFFPQLVTRQLIATATTDDCGHFTATFFKGCNNPDEPDLYFVAKQRVFPFLAPITIYAPTPIACNTWWNYRCGAEVTLVTTNPLAHTCAPCQPVVAGDRWVIVMAIGNLLLSRIYGTSEPLQPTTTSANLGLTDSGAPFGGLLRPRIEFDSSLRDDFGDMYYRVSFRRQGDPNVPTPLTATINRHYAHVVGGNLVIDAYNLGPKSAGAEGALFEIPPALPPAGQWSQPNVVTDTASGEWSTPMPTLSDDMAGLYEIRVDLFDSRGAPVDLVRTGIHFVVPTSLDATGTVYTTEAARLGLVQGNTFVMLVHVDNNSCSASTDAPTLNGGPANSCGVLEYQPGRESTSTVTMTYRASHPHDFATRSFVVSRAGTAIYSESGGVAGGAFSVTKTVAELLAGCPMAGFAEGLYVAATATDGWSRQSQYDAAPPPRGFVLAPPQPGPPPRP